MSNGKRPYRSPRRREQAEETRRRLLTASRRLFVQQGYAGATIESIAAAAGVAVQTVYAAFGSKQGILLALLDEMAAAIRRGSCASGSPLRADSTRPARISSRSAGRSPASSRICARSGKRGRDGAIARPPR
jgi:AcrR family transcriptional regulator